MAAGAFAFRILSSCACSCALQKISAALPLKISQRQNARRTPCARPEGFQYRSPENPDALPVGFTRDDGFADPYTGQRNVVVGLTCAACHTGELFYKDKAIRIDAGPSMLNLDKFNRALGFAVW
jgi:hypothetical protein